MDSKKSNKIREIVKLQQILKKWKKVATNASTNKVATNASTNNNSNSSISSGSSSGSKSIKFLKRTLSFNDVLISNVDIVPKGFLAVCVGKDLKRFIIPMDYLKHQAFEVLLHEAEEEFGFQQEGVLKIPCEISMFEKILKVVEDKKEDLNLHEFGFNGEKDMVSCDVTPTHHAQVCR